MMWLAGLLGGLGLVSMISRKSVLGLLIGVQLLVLGCSTMFILAGHGAGLGLQSHILGLFITLGGTAQLVTGYALAIRMFFLKRKTSMDDIRALKH